MYLPMYPPIIGDVSMYLIIFEKYYLLEYTKLVSWFTLKNPLNVNPDANFGPGVYVLKQELSFHIKLR